MVDVSPSSAKLSIYIPEFYGWFQYDVLYITGSYLFWLLGFLYVRNVCHIQCRQFYILASHCRSHLLGCFFLKYTLSPILKDGGVCSMVFWAVLNLFSSRVFFAIASASLCASRFNIPESGSPRKCCMGSNSLCKGRFGSLPYTKKNSISAVSQVWCDSVTGKNLVQITCPS